MARYVGTVTQKGQVTIPGPLRKALKIQPKDLVAFDAELFKDCKTFLLGRGSFEDLTEEQKALVPLFKGWVVCASDFKESNAPDLANWVRDKIIKSAKRTQ